MHKFIVALCFGLMPATLLAEHDNDWSITNPFGLEVGFSTLQEAKKTIEDTHGSFDFVKDPAKIYYRAITLDVPGWQQHQKFLSQFTANEINADNVFLNLSVDEQGIIQSLALSFRLETNQEAKVLYEKIDQALQEKGTPDKQYRLAEESYHNNIIVHNKNYGSLSAEIPQSVAVYRHEHINFLLYQGYGGELSEIPQQITLKDYGDIHYAEVATRPKLAWLNDQPSRYVMLVISSDTYQQLFDDLLAKYAASGDLTDAEKAMLDEALQR
ncbi:hypothetical protein L0B52_04570 [Suttonella sp. R2A3]|uniref:hypothetical protein n=1 Tax=Suttonella sp. R2A3 TaxID=2908648 RepID=UPI001F474A0B|nr:hypothetical protein [Suttonella sp. R2A3]UJF25424.1 hypothetical protein L0B52_04570 [Suttonella sp. R2A3]